MPFNQTDTVKIFIAYAEKDRPVREALVKHLSNLNIEIKHEGTIELGLFVGETITQYLQEADIILFLISADFWVNDKLQDIQVKQAIERHENKEVKVIPIITRHCNWKASDFGKLQVLPKRKDETGEVIPIAKMGEEYLVNEALLTEIAKEIQGIVQQLSGEHITQETSNSPRQTKLRDLVYLHCDRKPQNKKFVPCIEKRIDSDHNKPFFYLIHGPTEERHESLVKRFTEFNIYDLASEVISQTKGIVDFYRIKDFPAEDDLISQQEELKRSISNEIANLKGAHWVAKELLELFRNRTAGGVIVFQHNIFCDTWDAQKTPKLLQWYIQDFWNTPIEQENLYVIVFLNVVYPIKRKNLFKRLFSGNPTAKIQEQLKELEKSLKDHCNVLTVLEPVPLHDVHRWIKDHDLNQVEHLIPTIFGKKEMLPMNIVEDTFRTAVKELRRKEGQEAIRNM